MPVTMALAVAVVTAGLLAACGSDQDPAIDVPATIERTTTSAGGAGGDVGGDECPPAEDADPASVNELFTGLGSEPSPPAAGRPVAWELNVTNEASEPVVLTFASGQRGDVTLRRAGEEVYRWSEGRVFTQAFSCDELSPGETATYELEDDALDVEPGEYELVAEVKATPAPPPVSRTITIE